MQGKREVVRDEYWVGEAERLGVSGRLKNVVKIHVVLPGAGDEWQEADFARMEMVLFGEVMGNVLFDWEVEEYSQGYNAGGFHLEGFGFERKEE